MDLNELHQSVRFSHFLMDRIDSFDRLEKEFKKSMDAICKKDLDFVFFTEEMTNHIYEKIHEERKITFESLVERVEYLRLFSEKIGKPKDPQLKNLVKKIKRLLKRAKQYILS